MALHRRNFLKTAGIACLGAVSGLVAPASAAEVRSLAFDHLWTGERLSVEYWVHGAYVPGALACIDRVLRDFRTGDVHPVAHQLLDLLFRVHRVLDSAAPFEAISAYRSPKTNAMLHETTSGVATDSLHMDGMAIDIRVPGCALSDLRRAAIALTGGGVGYYPKSKFVHLDAGRVRNW